MDLYRRCNFDQKLLNKNILYIIIPMSPNNLKERIEYLTSLRIFTSDKYGIWGWDPLGVIGGLIFLIWGMLNYAIPGFWRLILIILGALLFTVCIIRIERRYSKFKNEIFRELNNIQYH